jgi:hypothetical protein
MVYSSILISTITSQFQSLGIWQIFYINYPNPVSIQIGDAVIAGFDFSNASFDSLVDLILPIVRNPYGMENPVFEKDMLRALEFFPEKLEAYKKILRQPEALE